MTWDHILHETCIVPETSGTLVTRELCMSGYMVSWCIRGWPLSVQNTSKHLGVRNDRKWLTSTWCFFVKIGERFGSHSPITPIMVLMMKIEYLLKLANFTRIFPKKSTARLQWVHQTLQFGKLAIRWPPWSAARRFWFHWMRCSLHLWSCKDSIVRGAWRPFPLGPLCLVGHYP